jgi:hypothetical protein
MTTPTAPGEGVVTIMFRISEAEHLRDVLEDDRLRFFFAHDQKLADEMWGVECRIDDALGAAKETDR